MYRKLFIKIWPVIFIFFIWFVFSAPYFLHHKVPFPSTYAVNFFPPWNAYHLYDGPVKNSAMPDVIDQIYPWRYFTVESWKAGQIPLWNPYSFGGTPHLANYQSAVLSPFNILFFLFSFVDAWSLLVLFQPLLAGLFGYFYYRSLSISKSGSLLSSIAFMFCGFITTWMDYATLGYAILFLPLALFAVEKFLGTKKGRYLLLLAISIPLSFFSGHFQISLYVLLFIFVYIGYKAFFCRPDRSDSAVEGSITTEHKHKPKFFINSYAKRFLALARNDKQILFLLLTTICGLLMAMPQILPSLEFYTQSLRSSLFQQIEAIPLGYLPTFLSPDFFGNPVTRNDWFGHYAEWNGYIGVLPFMLAIYAILRKRTKFVYFLSILSLIVLLLAFNTPILSLVIALHIPVLSTSAASRIIVLFSFLFTILAGFGFDSLLEDIKDRKLLPIIVWVASFLLIFLVLWGIVVLKLFIPLDKIIVAKQNLKLPTIIFAVIAVCSFGGYFFVTLFVKEALVKNDKAKKENKVKVSNLKKKKNTAKIEKKTSLKLAIVPLFIAILFLVITSFDLLRFVTKWQPFDPPEFVFPSVSVMSNFPRLNSYDRMFGDDGAQISVYNQLPSIEGYDPLYIKRYGELLSSTTGILSESDRSVVNLNKSALYTPDILTLLDVKYILQKNSDNDHTWGFPFTAYPANQFTRIYNDNNYQVFRNNLPIQHAFFAQNYVVKSKPQEILDALFKSHIHLDSTVVLEEDPHITPGNVVGKTQIIQYTPNEIRIQAQTNKDALLFLSEVYYPGWRAYVDGQETKIYRTDYTFRSIIVPSGQHTVIFRYEPLIFTVGLWMSLVGILGICILSFLSRKKLVQ